MFGYISCMATVSPFTDWREARRFRALELYQQGWKRIRIAEALGVSPAAVSQWLAKVAAAGPTALEARKAAGPSPRLTPAQLATVPALLTRGAKAYGVVGDVWTSERVAEVIAREFGVRYHPSHVRRLLKHLGWSRQKPRRRATQRDEAAIATWAQERYPALKKCQSEGRTLLFIDESGLYLLPGVVRTWAPQGETPILHHRLTNDHLSLISAISPAGALYFQGQDQAYTSDAVIAFWEHLHTQVPGKLLVIWDGAPIHRSKAIKAYLAAGAAAWLHLERLPGYAPDLNPDEGIWHYLKHVELKNQCFATLADLDTAARAALQRIRNKPDIVQACYRQIGDNLSEL